MSRYWPTERNWDPTVSEFVTATLPEEAELASNFSSLGIAVIRDQGINARFVKVPLRNRHHRLRELDQVRDRGWQQPIQGVKRAFRRRPQDTFLRTCVFSLSSARPRGRSGPEDHFADQTVHHFRTLTAICSIDDFGAYPCEEGS